MISIHLHVIISLHVFLFLHRIVPSENIAVGIERQIRGNSPAVIRRELRPSEVILRRRREEGEVALCERDEFSRQSGDVDEPERRVIRVTDRNMIHQDYSSSRTASVKYSERLVCVIVVEHSVNIILISDKENGSELLKLLSRQSCT